MLVADDDTRVGLAHLNSFWRRAEIGLRLDDAAYAALKGKRIDKIVALADRMEEVRASLDKSLESLLTASRNMMLAATYDPMRG